MVKRTPIDVMRPKRTIGSMSLKRKVRKLIAVVIDVKMMAFPILSIRKKKNAFLSFTTSFCWLVRCIKSEIATINKMAGVIIITNSIPPKRMCETPNVITILIITLAIVSNTSRIFWLRTKER